MHDLTQNEQQTLKGLLQHMIPASVEFDAPGAVDAAIFDDILASMGRETNNVRNALHLLDSQSQGSFLDLDDAEQAVTALTFLDCADPSIFALSRLVLPCYYRDLRVTASLGMEARPPSPKGFDVEQGDWSLLDPVRQMPKIYRKVP
jgi:hypothetical protein